MSTFCHLYLMVGPGLNSTRNDKGSLVRSEKAAEKSLSATAFQGYSSSLPASFLVQVVRPRGRKKKQDAILLCLSWSFWSAHTSLSPLYNATFFTSAGQGYRKEEWAQWEIMEDGYGSNFQLISQSPSRLLQIHRQFLSNLNLSPHWAPYLYPYLALFELEETWFSSKHYQQVVSVSDVKEGYFKVWILLTCRKDRYHC